MRAASLSRFVATPETRSALVAVRGLARGLAAGKPPRTTDPLFLHGPPGVGKTHLATGLLAAVADVGRTARLIAAAEIVPAPDGPPDALEGADACDLLIVEDVQHLSPSAADAFARLIDYRTPRRRPTLVTANMGLRNCRDCRRGSPAGLRRAGRGLGAVGVAEPAVRATSLGQRAEVEDRGGRPRLDRGSDAGRRPAVARGHRDAGDADPRGTVAAGLSDCAGPHRADQADGRSPVERVIRHVSQHFGLKPRARRRTAGSRPPCGRCRWRCTWPAS